MTSVDWRSFLQRYNDELLGSHHVAEAKEYEPEVAAAVETGWLGFPGASDDEIAHAEERLGVALPPGYRSFLQVSNGWWCPGLNVPRLWSVDEVDWLANTDPFTIQVYCDDYRAELPEPISDDDYYRYDDGGSAAAHFREDHLRRAVQISAQEMGGTAYYLLIPDAVSPDGEWEAWLLAHWVPGAQRYRSLWDLMNAERAAVLSSETEENKRVSPGSPPPEVVAKLPNLIAKLEEGVRFHQDHKLGFPLPGPVNPMLAPTGPLRDTANRVRKMYEQNLDPATVVAELRSLADSLEEEADTINRECNPTVNPARSVDLRWKVGFNPWELAKLVRGANRLQRGYGLSQASTTIRWFLQHVESS